METTGLHNLPMAGFMRRLMAALYDWLLVIALMMVLSVPLVAPGNEAITPGNPFYRLGLVAIIAAFFVGFWVTKGQTLGMRAWRLQLTTEEGASVTRSVAVMRFLCACVSAAALGAGFFWALIDRDRLTWHDRICGTRMLLRPKSR